MYNKFFKLNIYKKKHKGRGNSTNKGNTLGKGKKGQKIRSGYKIMPFFEGGQSRQKLLFFKSSQLKKRPIHITKILITQFYQRGQLFFKNFKKHKKTNKMLYLNRLYNN